MNQLVKQNCEAHSPSNFVNFALHTHKMSNCVQFPFNFPKSLAPCRQICFFLVLSKICAIWNTAVTLNTPLMLTIARNKDNIMTEKEYDNGGEYEISSTILPKLQPNIWNKVLILPPFTCENI